MFPVHSKEFYNSMTYLLEKMHSCTVIAYVVLSDHRYPAGQ